MPHHLRTLAGVSGDVTMALSGPVTQAAILDALEERYPMLRGTIRDHVSKQRRDFVRFFVCGEDWSHISAETELPQVIADGTEPFRIVGAMAGG